MSKEKINYWFWKRGNNFGDMLNIPVLNYISKNKYEFRYVGKYSQHKLLAVGSVLNKLTPYNVVWGAGSIQKRKIKIPVGCKILAVRGPLTKKMLGINKKIAYGDPGLLMPEIYVPIKLEKKYDIGILPHYVDHSFMKIKDESILMINVKANYKKIINQINSCDLIITSSLHGVLVSEAYNKPVVWIKSPSNRIIGGSFKFNDYFLSTNREKKEPVIWNSNITKLSNDKNILEKGYINLDPLKKAWRKFYG